MPQEESKMDNNTLRKILNEYVKREERNLSWIARKVGFSDSAVRKFATGEKGMSEERKEILLRFLEGGMNE